GGGGRGRGWRKLGVGRIVQDRRGQRAAEVDVETGPVALVVGIGKSRQSLADAADQRAAIFHRLQRLGERRGGVKAERDARTGEKKDWPFHEAALLGTVILEPWTGISLIWEIFFERHSIGAR